MDGTHVLQAVARKRGCLLRGRGGELDLEKAAMLFLTDYRNGTLGRISLETPATRQSMLQKAGKKQKSERGPVPQGETCAPQAD
jgi:ribosome biogenesis GTPase A